MASVAGRSFTIAELEKALRVVDADVLLVRPRLLQRVIREDARIVGFGTAIPHRKTYVLERQRLLKVVSADELTLSFDGQAQSRVVLLARPAESIASARSGDVLLKYWRLLFHARVHKLLEAPEAQARLSAAAIRDRIQRIGQTRFEEIRHVLREEKFLIHPHDDRAVYVEFAALYLELRYFANELLIHYFPSISAQEGVEALLREDLDFETLFEQSRPPGASEPLQYAVSPVTEVEDRLGAAGDFPLPEQLAPVTEDMRRRYLQKASEASANGNSVRALLLKTRVALAANETVTRFGSGDELDQFVDRLRHALQIPEAKQNRWRACLRALLACATQGIFPVEARLLYDLQRTCLDVERMTYSDIVDWITGLGRRAYRRPLPLHGLVQQVKHLRSAERRARVARLPDMLRSDILGLIEDATTRAEERVCDNVRPILADALDRVGLQAANLPERLARTKVIEELLDRIVSRGFFSMGDLRDAIARNRLKLPDLSGPFELVTGDPLLRLNRRLADSMAGIYRPGEIYLRALQRGASVFFGNLLGRILTLFLLLPFGGAFIALYFVQFMIEEGHEHLGTGELHVMPPFRLHMPEHDLTRVLTQTAIVGVVFFALIHWRAFRALVWAGLRLSGLLLGRLFGLVLFEWPAKLFRSTPVRAVFDSAPIALFRRYAMRPVLATLIALNILMTILTHWTVLSPETDVTVILAVGAGVLVTSSIFFNSKLGRTVEEDIADWFLAFWQALSADLLPGLARWILARFRELSSLIERSLYQVDEWLRFRTGDSQFALVYKPVLGLVWFLLAYLIRFTMNLVVEPQINPIKHFPVVTVSHKFILPFTLLATKELERTLAGGAPPVRGEIHAGGRMVHLSGMFRYLSPKTLGGAVGLVIQFIIPGICGYLAWELRSNWRLYRKNQSATLDPVPIGHHGETMLRFIRPGLHSGTVPKLHARIRKAMRRGRWRSFNKRRADLQHVEEAIRHFVSREFIALLLGSQGWRQQRLEVDRVELGSNNIQVDIQSPDQDRPALRISFEQQSGWLIAGIAEPGWSRELDSTRLLTLTNALAGFYKLCGVDFVREQVNAVLGSKLRWSVDTHGLIAWPTDGTDCSASYPLSGNGMVEPVVSGTCSFAFPQIAVEQVRLSAVPIKWDRWVDAWNRDQQGEAVAPLVGLQLVG